VIRLIRIEWTKTFCKIRTYIGFIAIGVVLPLIFVGIKMDEGGFLKNSQGYKTLEETFLISGNLLNGLFVSQMAMFSLLVHVPLFIALVAGDQVAGEASSGTLRMVLTRPPSRSRILATKVAVTFIYTILLVAFLAVLSLGLGIIMFGIGDLLVRGEGLLILSREQAITRFLIAYPLAMLSMGVIAALAILLSVMVDNAIGPILGTMAIVIVSFIISETPISLFEKIRPFLFTTYTKVWRKAFLYPIPSIEIGLSITYLLGYTFLFLSIAFYIFNRRDILS